MSAVPLGKGSPLAGLKWQLNHFTKQVKITGSRVRINLSIFGIRVSTVDLPH